jgi:hypothetical protein
VSVGTGQSAGGVAIVVSVVPESVVPESIVVVSVVADCVGSVDVDAVGSPPVVEATCAVPPQAARKTARTIRRRTGKNGRRAHV